MRIFLTNQGQNGVSRYQNIDSPNGLSYSSVNRADFCGCPFSTSILADNISHPQSLELHHNTLLLKKSRRFIFECENRCYLCNRRETHIGRIRS